MEYSLLLMSKISAMLVWALIGFIMVRSKLMTEEDGKPISVLIIYALIPCAIVRAFLIDLTKERLISLLVGIAFAGVAMVLWIIMTALLRKPLRLTPVDEMSLIYSNCGNLVIPLVLMTMGSEYVFYVAAFQIVFNALLWTHGAIVLRGKDAINIKKIFLSPHIISIMIALFLMFTGIKLPDIVETAMNGLADMLGPASMISIGMIIAASDIGKMLRVKRAYPLAIGRLIIYPMAALLLLYASGFLKYYPEHTSALMISTLSACAPTATIVPQLALVHNKDSYTASVYNVITTFLCMFSMPFIIFVYQTLFH